MIVILMGVAGSGKTTVGELLAHHLGWRFYDGDNFHSPHNREKMRRGEPLTEEDREPWLEALHELIRRCEQSHQNAVLAASALKQSYRERLTAGFSDVRLVYLKGTRELIAQRIACRHGHFFDPALLQSQFDVLEEPADARAVDISGTPEQIAANIVAALGTIEPGH
ncbi:MAG TPA: gluconokinase [Candidatus Binataceae bacterium]|nr:gluconokinase [Candidatus Binataceae bacterium]